MTEIELTRHLVEEHGIDRRVAHDVIGVLSDPTEGGVYDVHGESYLRGFHDGMHGRVDSDDLAFRGHDHGHGSEA